MCPAPEEHSWPSERQTTLQKAVTGNPSRLNAAALKSVEDGLEKLLQQKLKL